MVKRRLQMTVNGHGYDLEIAPHRTLLSVLREDLGLLGTKSNCQEGECGVCTVLVDGLAVNSCIYPAMRAQGRQVLTVEGLAAGQRLHPVQQAFLDRGAVQCGYCIPGMIMSAVALLQENPRPAEPEIRRYLAGNLCRCTGYAKIIAAVQAAARAMDEAGDG